MRNEEREFCYAFEGNVSNNTIHAYFTDFVLNAREVEHYPPSSGIITEHYLNRETIIRNFKNLSILERKTDEKAQVGIREQSHDIDNSLAEMLLPDAKLIVKKERLSWICDKNRSWIFSIDTFEKPMNIKMATVNCLTNTTYNEVLTNVQENVKLMRNVKNAWDYFKRKIGFCGAPACGKTIMARRMANELSINYKASSEAVSEFARSYISHYGPPEWYIQPLIMWQQQLREHEARYADIVICDSPTFLSSLYCQYYNKTPLDDTSTFILSEMYKSALQAVRTYSDIILLEQKNLKNDNLRYQSETDNDKIHAMIKNFLNTHNVPYIQIDYTKDLSELIQIIFQLNSL